MIVTQHSQERVGTADCPEIIWQLFVQCLVSPPIFFLIKNSKIALRTNCVPVLAKFLSELVSNIWNIFYQILTLAWCKSLSKICALQDEFDQILVNKRGYLRPTLKASESHSLLDNIAIRARTLSEILPSERALFQKYYHPSAHSFRNITNRVRALSEI